jgi:DNA polymerase I
VERDLHQYQSVEDVGRHEPFIEDIQEDLVAVLDETRSPEAVCDRLQRALSQLRNGKVDPAKLVIEQRTSKTVNEYAHTTRTVAALEQAADDGRGIQPGQGVSYVVVDDSKQSRERVELADEADEFDAEFYAEELLRAAESVVSPLGWREDDIRAYLAERTDASITAFGEFHGKSR